MKGKILVVILMLALVASLLAGCAEIVSQDDFDALEERVETLEGNVTDLDARVSALEGRVTALEELAGE